MGSSNTVSCKLFFTAARCQDLLGTAVRRVNHGANGRSILFINQMTMSGL